MVNLRVKRHGKHIEIAMPVHPYHDAVDAHYRTAVDMAAIFSESDLAGNITYVNKQFCAISGYSAEELLGANHSILNSGHHSSEFFVELWRTIASGHVWHGELCNRAKDGSLYWVDSTIVPLVDADSQQVIRYVSIRFDVTEKHRLLESVQWQANHDVLTGLPNRALLADRLDRAVASALRHQRLLAVCLLDLDGFKAINDQHGHACGDLLLTQVADRLTHVMRSDDTVARLGGDEFVLLLTNLPDASEVETLLQRVLAMLAKPFPMDNGVVEISASIGVALYRQEDFVPDTLLRHADQALYEAKRAGRNRVHFFDVSHDQHAAMHYQTLARVTQALEQGELVLYYQPKVNMRSGCVVGFEALLRWQHPQDGLVPPLVFLPLVEQSNLIVDIGEWVIDQALEQIARWAALGHAWPVSVNIAARQLQKPDFVERLAMLLSRHPGIAPRMLEIEILESVALDNIHHVNQCITASQNLGVTFSLDDFGTGYSSLSYLKRLPAQTLKIDQSFVRDILNDKDSLALTEAVIHLASVFGRQVIAEGVETVEHGVLLMQLDCDLGQGYGIARPMPATEVIDWAAHFVPDPAWATSYEIR